MRFLWVYIGIFAAILCSNLASSSSTAGENCLPMSSSNPELEPISMDAILDTEQARSEYLRQLLEQNKTRIQSSAKDYEQFVRDIFGIQGFEYYRGQSYADPVAARRHNACYESNNTLSGCPLTFEDRCKKSPPNPSWQRETCLAFLNDDRCVTSILNLQNTSKDSTLFSSVADACSTTLKNWSNGSPYLQQSNSKSKNVKPEEIAKVQNPNADQLGKVNVNENSDPDSLNEKLEKDLVNEGQNSKAVDRAPAKRTTGHGETSKPTNPSVKPPGRSEIASSISGTEPVLTSIDTQANELAKKAISECVDIHNQKMKKSRGCFQRWVPKESKDKDITEPKITGSPRITKTNEYSCPDNKVATHNVDEVSFPVLECFSNALKNHQKALSANSELLKPMFDTIWILEMNIGSELPCKYRYEKMRNFCPQIQYFKSARDLYLQSFAGMANNNCPTVSLDGRPQYWEAYLYENSEFNTKYQKAASCKFTLEATCQNGYPSENDFLEGGVCYNAISRAQRAEQESKTRAIGISKLDLPKMTGYPNPMRDSRNNLIRVPALQDFDLTHGQSYKTIGKNIDAAAATEGFFELRPKNGRICHFDPPGRKVLKCYTTQEPNKLTFAEAPNDSLLVYSRNDANGKNQASCRNIRETVNQKTAGQFLVTRKQIVNDRVVTPRLPLDRQNRERYSLCAVYVRASTGKTNPSLDLEQYKDYDDIIAKARKLTQPNKEAGKRQLSEDEIQALVFELRPYAFEIQRAQHTPGRGSNTGLAIVQGAREQAMCRFLTELSNTDARLVDEPYFDNYFIDRRTETGSEKDIEKIKRCLGERTSRSA